MSHTDHIAAGRQTAHKNLKPDMVVLTQRGWRTVESVPQPWLIDPARPGLLRVPFVGGEAAIEKPDHLWVRRTNHPLT